jgi:hypothetical protein
MTVDPMQSVKDALGAQTAAIAALSGELAEEHEQWLAAAAAGDTAQAAAIVAEVQKNTDKLNAMTAALDASDPSGAPPVEGITPEVPGGVTTLPGEVGPDGVTTLPGEVPSVSPRR